MGNKLSYIIDEKNNGVKLIHFLKVEVGLSSRITRKMSREGLGYINGRVGINSDLLKTGDLVEIHLDGNESQDISPEDISIDVIYEDEDLLIVNKPPFMVVHPTKSHQSGTLANGVMNYFKQTGQDCIVRLVNRLDRDTSGLVIIAKSQFAHSQMANRLIGNEVEKYYTAIVHGSITESRTIDLPIGRPTLESIKREVMEGGQRAVTHFDVLNGNDVMTCLWVKLETGRTHQIRVHLTHIGHPLVGDSLYGEESELMNRQALHATRLCFHSIRTNERITITADLPEDMNRLLSRME